MKKSQESKEKLEKEIEELQLRVVRIQQGLWHNKKRAIIMFEGFDAAGKGGAIRSLTENLDPRGFKVHPVGPPTEDEKSKHWLYRFWRDLPSQGSLAIFDRSWYGRVLVEKVEALTPKERLHAAFGEINEFEKLLVDDGITVIKIFLAISKDEQLERFEERLKDPYKHWKISMDDIKARKKWKDYVHCMDQIFEKTHTKKCPWHLISADSKHHARREVLKIVIKELHFCEKWMESEASHSSKKKFAKSLKELT